MLSKSWLTKNWDQSEKIIAASKQITVPTVVVNMAEAIASKQIAVPTVVVN